MHIHMDSHKDSSKRSFTSSATAYVPVVAQSMTPDAHRMRMTLRALRMR